MKAAYYHESDSVKPLAEQAKIFLDERLAQDTICLSAQIVAELHHVLTSRGRRLAKSEAESLIADLLGHDHVQFCSPDHHTLTRAISLSTQTCVHIWDFLAVLPFEGELDRIYTMDPHFRSCPQLQLAPVENPLGIWVAEGRSEP